MTILIDQTIELFQLAFHYRKAGNPKAPPLILLHGLTSDAQDWNEIAMFLAQWYHVFALDQRGHGESARTDEYSLELMRDDLKAFADGLSLGRFTLIGHSMGGRVASLFSEKWADRIDHLVLEDTTPPYPGGMDPDEPRPPEEAPEEVPFDWRVLTSIVRQLDSPDPSWWNDLRKITVPTLIIGGGSTSHFPQEKLVEAARLIPDCRLVTVEGAGHGVHQTRIEEYKDLLREFLLL